MEDRRQQGLYNKYYKRYAARVRVKQIKEDAFKKWKYQAIALRDDCADGKITAEEYTQWMEDSESQKHKKSLLLELKRSNRRDFLMLKLLRNLEESYQNGIILIYRTLKALRHKGFPISPLIPTQWCRPAWESDRTARG